MASAMNAPARSALEFSDDAWVINSFSKYFSMVGWRLGWLVAPVSKVSQAWAYLANMFLTAPSLSQHAALAAFDDIDRLDGHVAAYKENRDYLIGGLRSLRFTHIAPPDAAFYLYVRTDHLGFGSFDLCIRLL